MTNHFNFSHVTLAPADPILGISEKFINDTRPNKVNLGVGVYQNQNGKAAKLEVVKKAESFLLETDQLATYSAIDGVAEFRTNAQNSLFGQDHPALSESLVATIQSPGGTGAIRLGAEFLKLFASDRDVYISDPTWDNHRAIFHSTGFNVLQYPYYDAEKKSLDFDGCYNSLSKAKDGSIIILHAACHNPTGYDFTNEQWDQILELSDKKGFILFMDIAYQGFLKSLNEDPWIIQRLAKKGTPFLVASSFSKNLGLYAERVGALHIVTDSKDATLKVQSQLKQIVRAIYSNPPGRGSKIINTIFADSNLKSQWITELDTMRERVKQMRQSFCDKISKSNASMDFSHVTKQNGMFSYSGLSKEQAIWLREEKAIYVLDSGRICVAALNDNNLDYVIESIAEATLVIK